MKHLFLQQTLLNPNLKLLGAAEPVAHRRESHVESQADHELAVRHVAASLDDILRLDFKSGRIVNLLEVTREVALMIVLPFYQATNLICEFRVAHVATSFVHGALVASFERGHLDIIPETATLVARLVV